MLTPEEKAIQLLSSIVDKSLVSQDMIKKLVENLPSISQIISTEDFYSICNQIYQNAFIESDMAAMAHDPVQRAQIQNAAEKMFSIQQTSIAPEGVTFDSWLASKGLNFEGYTKDEFETMFNQVVSQATGTDINNVVALADIQQAMISILTQLSSYTIQLVANVTGNDTAYFNWPQIRLGNVRGSGTGELIFFLSILQILSVGGKAATTVLSTKTGPYFLDVNGKGKSNIKIDLLGDVKLVYTMLHDKREWDALPIRIVLPNDEDFLGQKQLATLPDSAFNTLTTKTTGDFQFGPDQSYIQPGYVGDGYVSANAVQGKKNRGQMQIYESLKDFSVLQHFTGAYEQWVNTTYPNITRRVMSTLISKGIIAFQTDANGNSVSFTLKDPILSGSDVALYLSQEVAMGRLRLVAGDFFNEQQYDWTMEDIFANGLPVDGFNPPIIISPQDNSQQLNDLTVIISSPTKFGEIPGRPLNHAATDWEIWFKGIARDGDTSVGKLVFSSYNDSNNKTSIVVPKSNFTESGFYYAVCLVRDSNTRLSGWSSPLKFNYTVPVAPVTYGFQAPVITSPHNPTPDPSIYGFGNTMLVIDQNLVTVQPQDQSILQHDATDWEVYQTNGIDNVLVWSSYNDKINRYYIQVPGSVFSVDSDYLFVSRVRDQFGIPSNWSTAVRKRMTPYQLQSYLAPVFDLANTVTNNTNMVFAIDQPIPDPFAVNQDPNIAIRAIQWKIVSTADDSIVYWDSGLLLGSSLTITIPSGNLPQGSTQYKMLVYVQANNYTTSSPGATFFITPSTEKLNVPVITSPIEGNSYVGDFDFTIDPNIVPAGSGLQHVATDWEIWSGGYNPDDPYGEIDGAVGGVLAVGYLGNTTDLTSFRIDSNQFVDLLYPDGTAYPAGNYIFVVSVYDQYGNKTTSDITNLIHAHCTRPPDVVWMNAPVIVTPVHSSSDPTVGDVLFQIDTSGIVPAGETNGHYSTSWEVLPYGGSEAIFSSYLNTVNKTSITVPNSTFAEFTAPSGAVFQANGYYIFIVWLNDLFGRQITDSVTVEVACNQGTAVPTVVARPRIMSLFSRAAITVDPVTDPNNPILNLAGLDQVMWIPIADYTSFYFSAEPPPHSLNNPNLPFNAVSATWEIWHSGVNESDPTGDNGAGMLLLTKTVIKGQHDANEIDDIQTLSAFFNTDFAFRAPDTNIFDDQYSPNGTLYARYPTNGNYFFRVRMLDDQGNYSPWSDVKSQLITRYQIATFQAGDLVPDPGTTLANPMSFSFEIIGQNPYQDPESFDQNLKHLYTIWEFIDSDGKVYTTGKDYVNLTSITLPIGAITVNGVVTLHAWLGQSNGLETGGAGGTYYYMYSQDPLGGLTLQTCMPNVDTNLTDTSNPIVGDKNIYLETNTLNPAVPTSFIHTSTTWECWIGNYSPGNENGNNGGGMRIMSNPHDTINLNSYLFPETLIQSYYGADGSVYPADSPYYFVAIKVSSDGKETAGDGLLGWSWIKKP